MRQSKGRTPAREVAMLRMEHAEAERELSQAIEEGEEIGAKGDWETAEFWHDDKVTLIQRMFTTDEEVVRYENCILGLGGPYDGPSISEMHRERVKYLKSLQYRLKRFSVVASPTIL